MTIEEKRVGGERVLHIAGEPVSQVKSEDEFYDAMFAGEVFQASAELAERFGVGVEGPDDLEDVLPVI